MEAIFFGVLDGERSHTIAFTEQCADHYTTNTIDKNLVDVDGNDPSELLSVRVTAGTVSLTV